MAATATTCLSSGPLRSSFPASPDVFPSGSVVVPPSVKIGKARVRCERRSIDTAGRRMEDYNTLMKRLMRNPYEYHHDLGMNYTYITDKLIVGSQPQMPGDVDHLKEDEGVAYILCLQQDKDIEYWGIDFGSIVQRCEKLGICHMRRLKILIPTHLEMNCQKLYQH